MNTSTNKTCTNCQQTFHIEEEDRPWFKKFDVPEPTQCPDCRNQRRLMFRNDRRYYVRPCDMCKKQIVSIYSTDKPFPVYCKDCFWSDKFNPLDYGQDIDFTKPFIPQFAEMRAKLPRIAIYNTQSENCDYTVHSSKNRNCYMASSLLEAEDVHYSDFVFYAKDTIDCYLSFHMERCYMCVECEKCYNSEYLENCQSVNFSYLNFNCRSSSNLIGCVGLRNKEYQILNQSCKKEKFEETLKKLHTDPKFRAEFVEKYLDLKKAIPVADSWLKNSENCSGNYITNSKNAFHAYNVKDVEDGRYIYELGNCKDAMDCTRVAGGEMIYECKAGVDLKYSKFTNLCYQSANLEYCDNCQNAQDSFGCMSLKNNRYCILNKQYTEAEYKELLPKLVAHMRATKEYGEFFPTSLSSYGYNETKAMYHYPLTKEEALKKGYKWKEDEGKHYLPQTYVMPENIADVKDDITNAVLACNLCGKNYKIIPQELKFYRNNGIPIPKKCLDCRHMELVALQNKRKLYERKCAHCKTEIQTTFSPDRPETVYCQKCYLEAVY